MNFMASPLDTLSKTHELEDLWILSSGFENLNGDDFSKIAKKAYFPYSFLDGQEKFSAPFTAFSLEWENTNLKNRHFRAAIHRSGADL